MTSRKATNKARGLHFRTIGIWSSKRLRWRIIFNPLNRKALRITSILIRWNRLKALRQVYYTLDGSLVSEDSRKAIAGFPKDCQYVTREGPGREEGGACGLMHLAGLL
jgi:hypothetical protein